MSLRLVHIELAEAKGLEFNDKGEVTQEFVPPPVG